MCKQALLQLFPTEHATTWTHIHYTSISSVIVGPSKHLQIKPWSVSQSGFERDKAFWCQCHCFYEKPWNRSFLSSGLIQILCNEAMKSQIKTIWLQSLIYFDTNYWYSINKKCKTLSYTICCRSCAFISNWRSIEMFTKVFWTLWWQRNRWRNSLICKSGWIATPCSSGVSKLPRNIHLCHRTVFCFFCIKIYTKLVSVLVLYFAFFLVILYMSKLSAKIQLCYYKHCHLRNWGLYAIV